MTHKQIAKNLIDKFNIGLNDYDIWGADKNEASKKCALICIEQLKTQALGFDYGISVSRINDLEEVKQEIEKL